jgi:hypothetical protein
LREVRSPALEYTLKRTNSCIIAGDLPSSDPIDCLIYRAMVEEKYYLPSLDALPSSLIHTDLSQGNVLVDHDYNITGYETVILSSRS